MDLTPDQVARLKAAQQPKVAVEFQNLAGVSPEQQPFLWWPYLPLGRVVIVAGAPGHGKSQLAALIAGMASRGQLYPGDVTEPSRVLMLCAEDDLPMTVVPRLMAVNADLRMIDSVNIVTEYPDGLTAKGLIKLPTDAGIVHEWVKRYADARLIVLDPVASFFDRSHNMLVNQDTRDALGPLVAIAETYGVTVVIILHLNKSESKDFANRIAESHGFQALARSVIALGPHPDDPDRERGSRKVIAVTKANLVKPGNYAMECEVRSATLMQLTPPIETSELALLGKCDVTSDDLLLPSGERATRMEVVDWLAELVADTGWMKVNALKGAAKSDGWSWRVVDRVARSNGYQRVKEPGVEHGPWWMGGPKALVRAIPREGSTLESLEPYPPQDSKETQGDPSRGYVRGEPSPNQEDFMRWERERLGERDDDDIEAEGTDVDG